MKEEWGTDTATQTRILLFLNNSPKTGHNEKKNLFENGQDLKLNLPHSHTLQLFCQAKEEEALSIWLLPPQKKISIYQANSSVEQVNLTSAPMFQA